MENLTSTILLSSSTKILTKFKIEQKSVDLGLFFNKLVFIKKSIKL